MIAYLQGLCLCAFSCHHQFYNEGHVNGWSRRNCLQHARRAHGRTVCDRPASAGTERVSVGPGGVQGNGISSHATTVGNGRYVGYSSTASNLVSNDTNNVEDVFFLDRETGLTSRASVSSSGVQGNAASLKPALTADSRYVLFQSYASNMVAGDTNGKPDVFLRDRKTHTVSRVSVSSSGGQANGLSGYASFSPDGRYVLYYSFAGNLVPGDTNNASDIFLYEMATKRTERVSVANGGGQANGPSEFFAYMTAGNRYVVFNSKATNIIATDTNGRADVFMLDRQNNNVERVSVTKNGAQANGESIYPTVSADGRFVVFHSNATNLVTGDTNGKFDVFVRDRTAQTTTRVSVSSTEAEGNQPSQHGKISADGRYVAFESWATNLTGSDTNGALDVFVRDLTLGTTRLVSGTAGGRPGNGKSHRHFISTSSQVVVFEFGCLGPRPRRHQQPARPVCQYALAGGG